VYWSRQDPLNAIPKNNAASNYLFIDVKLLFVAIYVKCPRRGPVQKPSFKDEKKKLYYIT
jgi:hypothetical protein